MNEQADLLPVSTVHLQVAVTKLTCKGNHVGDDKLCHRTRVLEGRVKHGDLHGKEGQPRVPFESNRSSRTPRF